MPWKVGRQTTKGGRLTPADTGGCRLLQNPETGGRLRTGPVRQQPRIQPALGAAQKADR